uniref:DUF659 domain-containing protein n=1 Tax=Vitis vinifera TaxID=29760 RepID=A5BM44_VITVI|nr:hypothetical protein VITISV_009967 [Vitis vinifera]
MLQTVCNSELKRRSYSHCKSITLKCCGISLLLREFRSLFVQCYGIPPEATRYMPQAGTLRTSRWKPISQPCEFNLLLRKYFAALLSVCEISQTPFSPAKCQPNSEDFSTEDERLSFLSLGVRKSGEPYYQSMIDTIAEAGPDIKGPTGYEIGNTYLEEEVQELETTYYIFSLMDKVVEKVGEENVVQVVIDNEASFKAADMLLMEKQKRLFLSPCATHCIDLMLEDIASMKQIKETLDQAKMIIGFIYNSLKVVNLMKVFTKDTNLLRPGITHFATKFISLESLICYEADLKRMYTTNEWCEFNKDRSKKSLRDKVKLFVDDQGEFRSALTKKPINQSLLGLPRNEEGRETVHEDDGAINRRVGRHTNNATQERDINSRHKGKAPRTISSSFSSDDGDNGGSRRGGGSRGVGGTGEGTRRDGSTGGGYVSQRYSNTGTRASDSYGYDQSSSSSSFAYRGFGYYQYGVDPEQPSKPYFPDYGSSS